MLKKFLSTVSLSAILASGSNLVTADSTLPTLNTNFSNIYYFGDSLTDGRNRVGGFNLAGGIYPTGNVWAKYFSTTNGFDYSSNIARYNYAFQSARTYTRGTVNVIPGIIGTRVNPTTPPYQVNSFITTVGNSNARDLHTIWIGHNNFEDITNFNSISTVTNLAVDDIFNGVNKLINNGARNFLFLNLASFADTPYVQNSPPALKDILVPVANNYSNYFTSRLSLMANAQPENINIILLDLARLQTEIVNNPSAYFASGNFFLTAAQDKPGSNVHPSEEAQTAIGQWVSSLIQAPLPFVILPDFAVSMMDRNTQNIFSRQAYLKHHCEDEKGLRIYAEGNSNEQDFKKKINPFNTKSANGGGIGLGIEYQTEAKSTIGLKFSYDQNNIKFNNTNLSLKNADIKESTLSAYGFLFPWEKFNLAGTLSYAALDIDTKRQQTIGLHNRTENGNGTGQHFTAAAQIGYDFKPFEQITFTPYTSAAYHHVKIEDIKEKSQSSTALVIRPPKETAFFYRYGAELLAQFNVANIKVDPFINVAGVYESRSRSNKIQARSTSFERFFTLESTKVMDSDSYMEGTAGVNIGLSCKDTITAKFGGKFLSDKQSGHSGIISYTRSI